MLKIGGLEIGGFAALAPMAGVADRAMREICIKYGAGFCVGELTSAKGVSLGDKKSAELLVCTQNEKPMASQIFGYEPLVMAKAAEVAQNLGADFIDINMGCPAPKVANNGGGSALMKNPKLAGEIVRAVKEAVNLPVTAKIRSGWDKNNITATEVAKAVEQAGADMITVHARTRDQMYAPPVDMTVIKAVKEAVKIPVIGNGDIFSADDAMDMFKYTGCDGVMVARGCEGNPFIFRQIKELMENGKVEYFPTDTDKLMQALEHTKMLVEEKGESRGIKEARKHIAWYIKGMRDNSVIKNRVFKSNTLAEINELFDYMLSKLQ